jgi:hypothetical protein
MTALSVAAMASLAFVSVNALQQSPQSTSRPVRGSDLPVVQDLITVPPAAGIDNHGSLPSRPSRPDDSASRHASGSRKPIPSRAAQTEGGTRPAVTKSAAGKAPTPAELPGAVMRQPVRKPPAAKPPSLQPTISQRAGARDSRVSKRWQVGDVAVVWAAFLDLLRDNSANGQAPPH